MTPLIANAIPEQGFEIVRDAIGSILYTELKNQKKIQQFDEPINVFNSRSTPFQHSEVLMINVLLDSASYSQMTERSVQSGVNYFVDIYSSAKESLNNTGGLNSAIRRDKFLGMVRYILQDHHYKVLGLPLGCIMGTYVESFESFEPSNAQDSAFVTMTRLTFNVRLGENQSVWDGNEINTIFTGVRLDQTDKGYQYITETN